jgi:hypothetical protein
MKDIAFRKITVYSVLIILILLVSCEKNEEDKLLKDQLIGTWKSTNSYYKSYTFNKDNTFIDTTYYLYSDNPFDFKVLEIIAGDYLVVNGQITFSNIQLSYFNGQENENNLGHSTTYDPNYNLSFEGDILVLNQKDVFEAINKTNSSILGKWSHDKLVAVYDKNLTNKSTGGTVHGIYDFKSDLSVDWQYETSYDNIVDSGNLTTVYDLTDSKLSINQWGLYNLTVSFAKNKMIWIYADRTFQRKQ